jgi:putative phage-type endonuclease
MTIELEQRTDAWYAARCGSLGASAIADAIAKLKDGKTFGATSTNLRAKLVVERLTGTVEEGFKSAAMQFGIDNEELARIAYEAHAGVFVQQVGLIKHPMIEGTHASPDGLVGDDGLIEIKCPNSATHIETLKTEKIPTKYLYQMQWQMRCADRQWCDYVSFDPRLPVNLQLWVHRVLRDDYFIQQTEVSVMEFLEGVNADVEALRSISSGKERSVLDVEEIF